MSRVRRVVVYSVILMILVLVGVAITGNQDAQSLLISIFILLGILAYAVSWLKQHLGKFIRKP